MSSVKQNPADWSALLAQVDPAEIIAGVHGVLALAAAFNALRDPESPMSRLFSRLGLLADAAYLPDGGTANVAALQAMMGCSDDTVRRMVNRQGVAKHEPSGRGSSMYRPGDIARSSVTSDPLPADADGSTGVAPPEKKKPAARKNAGRGR